MIDIIDMDTNFLYFFDIAGTFAFAISGALVGVKKDMDIYGMFVLAFVTAVGGGTIRDTMIGRVPPFIFNDGLYVVMVILATLVVFFMTKHVERNMMLLNVSDAIGLGVFTCIGVTIAESQGIVWYGMILLGVMTATFGGMIRDVLAKEVPFVLRKDIYASASILGGFMFLGLDKLGLNIDINILITSISITTLRLYCMYYNVQLPKMIGKE